MGNSSSKDGGSSGQRTPTGPSSGPDLSSYPSFSKADTKESNRSLRNTIRTKIPGAKSSDSPRGSSSGLVAESSASVDKSDSLSVKNRTSTTQFVGSRRGSLASNEDAMRAASKDAKGRAGGVADGDEVRHARYSAVDR